MKQVRHAQFGSYIPFRATSDIVSRLEMLASEPRQRSRVIREALSLGLRELEESQRIAGRRKHGRSTRKARCA